MIRSEYCRTQSGFLNVLFQISGSGKLNTLNVIAIHTTLQ